MLHHSSKSALMAILEKLPPRSPDKEEVIEPQQIPLDHLKVFIIDNIAELQCLDKPDWIKNCTHVAEHFVATVEQKHGMRYEVCLIFDRCDVPMSLNKLKPQEKRGMEVRPLSTIGSQIPPKFHEFL